MFLQTAAVLMCFVVTALAQTNCTLDNQYTIDMTKVDHLLNGTAIKLKFYYDGTNNRTAIQFIDYSTHPSTKLHREVIEYNKEGIRHTIDPAGNCSSCPSGLVRLMVPHDFQDFAKYIGTDYIGHPNNKVTYDGYRFPLGTLNVTLLISVPECVPIMEQITGYIGSTPVNDILFYNGYKGSITDPDVFNITMCN